MLSWGPMLRNDRLHGEILDRFLRYVQIDTQSDEDSTTMPSTPGQWELLRLLEREIREIGLADVVLTEKGYLLATIPATVSKKVPTVAYFAHVDTAPDFTGKGVRPIVHRNYDGKPIALPDDPARVLDPASLPHLGGKRGGTIVTASGTTLLGADDKAGVTIVVSLAAELVRLGSSHPHGKIRICLNPDEEIGRGVDGLDLAALGADVAYTIDGETPGELQFESFSADKARITIEGVATHPGWAKGRMVNALVLAGKLLAALPREGISPETTEGRDGFLHPYEIEGSASKVELRVILRDFELAGLADKGERLRGLCAGLAATEPRARVHCEITPQYRNMRYWLEKDMRPVELASRAYQAVGLLPETLPIRGGTDGSRLTERGLPAPNLFDGAHALHGPLEWVAVEDMELSVRMLLELSRLWAS